MGKAPGVWPDFSLRSNPQESSSVPSQNSKVGILFGGGHTVLLAFSIETRNCGRYQPYSRHVVVEYVEGAPLTQAG